MEIETKALNESQDYVEVRLRGRLDLQSSDVIKTKLHQLVDTPISVTFMNLTEVNFIDSAGLSALVSGLRLARERDKDIILVGLNDQAKMIFKLTMLDRIFAIHPSMESALASL